MTHYTLCNDYVMHYITRSPPSLNKMLYHRSTYREDYVSFVGNISFVGNTGADQVQPPSPGEVTGLLDFLLAGDMYYLAH